MMSHRWQHNLLSAWKPLGRDRIVSKALQAYAALTTSADRGGVRDLEQLK